MRLIHALNTFAVMSAMTFGGAQAFAVDTLKISGASTTNNFLSAHVATVEKDAGVKLAMSPNNTGKGIVDLMSGTSDMSMTSEPLDIAVQAAKNAGASVKADQLVIHQVAEQEIVFAVHPGNPVAKLSWQQIREIHTGQIKNWKEVGGPDAPIVVYTDALTGGTRAMIKKVVLKGEEYGADCKAQENVKKASEMVAGDKNGFAGLGITFAKDAGLKLVDSTKLIRPLGFITKGPATPAQAKVISSFKSAVK